MCLVLDRRYSLIWAKDKGAGKTHAHALSSRRLPPCLSNALLIFPLFCLFSKFEVSRSLAQCQFYVSAHC